MTMKDAMRLHMMVSIKNIVVMICWTVLAIYFGKWWIALFATCCLSNFQYESNGGQEDDTENSAIDSPLDNP